MFSSTSSSTSNSTSSQKVSDLVDEFTNVVKEMETSCPESDSDSRELMEVVIRDSVEICHSLTQQVQSPDQNRTTSCEISTGKSETTRSRLDVEIIEMFQEPIQQQSTQSDYIQYSSVQPNPIQSNSEHLDYSSEGQPSLQKPKCYITECSRITHAKGLCSSHYGRIYNRCKTIRCVKQQVNNGKCVSCGAIQKRRLCRADGCIKSAKSGGFCIKDGGSKKRHNCVVDGCT